MAKKKKSARKVARKKAKRRRASSPRKKVTRKKVAKRSLKDVTTAKLQAELARRETEVERLQRERAEIADRLAEIDAVLTRLGASGGGAMTTRKRPRNKKNLADSLAAVLKGKQLSVTELSEVVQRSGYKTVSPNFRTIVNQTLIKDPKRFKKVARGVYTVD